MILTHTWYMTELLPLLQQEALPPVQFDWSSSGLTNPLDGR